MEIGHQLRALRIQKGLTQEELAERTDLSKGYISQLENDLSSPSMDTFFDILEVLGCPAADFFDEGPEEALTIYREEDMTMMEDAKHQTTVTWLNPDSNEHEMEPVILEFRIASTPHFLEDADRRQLYNMRIQKKDWQKKWNNLQIEFL